MFSMSLLIGSFGVVLLRRPVHSVLSLIFTFLNGAAIYILLGAEFVALSTVIVYVGAVSVLLMFVVMTIDKDEKKYKNNKKAYKYWALSLGVFFVTEIVLLTTVKNVSIAQSASVNISEIGRQLYTTYGLAFQGCAVLLLVAMVSAVIVTFQSRTTKNVKHQNTFDQVNRNPDEVVTLVKVKQGEGIQ